jgi:hypothetical protein
VIRRTRCKAHRTPEMTCGTKGPGCMVPGGCETRPSYGWPDKFDGEHPPRPERCKKHSLPGMEYMGSAARARKKRLLLETKEVRLRETLEIIGGFACLCARRVLPPSGIWSLSASQVLCVSHLQITGHLCGVWDAALRARC